METKLGLLCQVEGFGTVMNEMVVFIALFLTNSVFLHAKVRVNKAQSSSLRELSWVQKVD